MKKIKCKICGKKLKRIEGAHLRKTHGITSEEYLKRYPGAKTHTDEFIIKQKKAKEKLYEEKGSIMREKVGSRTFDFIKDKKFKKLLQRDYRSAKVCLKNKLWKPSIILYGGIIESILINRNKDARNFYEAIEASFKKEIITEQDYHKIHMIRDLRNFVHLQKEIKEGVEINEYWANTFSEICEQIIHYFKENG